MSIHLTGLGHRFGQGPWLFRELEITLRANRTYALTGPSGSGKSTLLSLLAGWLDPAEGTIDAGTTGRIGWVFQNPHGSPRRTAIEHVMLPLMARGDSVARARLAARDLLDRFGLGAAAWREFRALSGGEAQRLMLARAIASEPGLLLVDEPTAQLDPVTASEVNLALFELVKRDTVVVIATHDERTRAACTDHIDLQQFVPRPGAEPGGGQSHHADGA